LTIFSLVNQQLYHTIHQIANHINSVILIGLNYFADIVIHYELSGFS